MKTAISQTKFVTVFGRARLWVFVLLPAMLIGCGSSTISGRWQQPEIHVDVVNRMDAALTGWVISRYGPWNTGQPEIETGAIDPPVEPDGRRSILIPSQQETGVQTLAFTDAEGRTSKQYPWPPDGKVVAREEQLSKVSVIPVEHLHPEAE